MNRKIPLKSICAAFLAVASTAIHAQTSPWQTLYDAPGHVYTAVLDPFSGPAHPQPSLFIGGRSDRTSPANPFSVAWVGPFDGLTSPEALVADPSASGCLNLGFASGLLYSVGAGSGGWQVRASADSGGTWTTVETPFSAGGPNGSQAQGFAADGAGNIFVCGWATDSNRDYHWIVRKCTAGAWSTIRDWSAARKSYSAAKMHVAGGYLFVVGTADNQWAVQRMNRLNGVWDAPSTGGAKGKSAGAVAVTSHGTDIYMLGWTGGVAQAPASVTLLKSSNLATGPWTTIKTFTESPQINRPGDLAFDVAGNLYVVGDSTFYTSAQTWNEAWIVRRCDTSGVWQSWTPLTDNPASQRSFARQISISPTTGVVYVSGTAQNIINGQLSPTWRAIVQQLPHP